MWNLTLFPKEDPEEALWSDARKVCEDLWQASYLVLGGNIPIDPEQPIDPPWPSPEFLKRCEEVESGSTKKIFKYAKIRQQRRHQRFRQKISGKGKKR